MTKINTDKMKLIITPQTKVSELLDAYPQLEEVLFEISPAFSKLKNPILRKTVAKIASLQQAAIVGKISVDDLVNRLRKEVGQELFSGAGAEEVASKTAPPWFDEEKITIRFNAIPIINAGNSPMAEILSQASLIEGDDILELKAPFIPAPIIDKIREKGFEAWSVQRGSVVLNYFQRSKAK
jgi:hypothetical protein